MMWELKTLKLWKLKKYYWYLQGYTFSRKLNNNSSMKPWFNPPPPPYMVKSGNDDWLWLLVWYFPLRHRYFWVDWGCQINIWRFWTTLFICYFGPVYVLPQHARSWWVEFQAHNIFHRDNRLCPSILLYALQYIPFLQFLPVVSSCAPYYHPLSSSPSAAPPAPSHLLGQYPPVPTTS